MKSGRRMPEMNPILVDFVARAASAPSGSKPPGKGRRVVPTVPGGPVPRVPMMKVAAGHVGEDEQVDGVERIASGRVARSGRRS